MTSAIRLFIFIPGVLIWAIPLGTLANESGRIDTVAGDGTSSDVGQPFGVELGPGGDLFICEVENHRIRRLNLKTGELHTVAGTGQKGYRGDGGPATKAALNEPYEVRFDAAGNMFFVEMRNHIVRRVDAKTGIISTIAGTGEPGCNGDDGEAIKIQLSSPHSIALDGRGGLYIADIGNHRIRKVDLPGGTIQTIAGTGEKKLPADGQTAKGNPILGPRALYIDGRTLWIALREGHSVWKMDLDRGVLQHVAGTGAKGYSGDGGPAQKATFNGPKGIAVGPDGNVDVVDTENQVIRRIHVGSGIVTTIAGAGPEAVGYGGDGGPATSAKMDRPHGICTGSDGTVYIGDTNNHRVRRVRFAATSSAGGAANITPARKISILTRSASEGPSLALRVSDGHPSCRGNKTTAPESPALASAASLESGWDNPPRDARLRAYWWWLNGCVTKAAITRDLEEMKAKGFGGALICDADGSSQDGNDRAPHGPTFLSPQWRELYKHTLREADRLGLEMSLNIQSGWNLGGPMVTADDAAKKLVWSETRLSGPVKLDQSLPEPAGRDSYYRDALVVAYRLKPVDGKDSPFGGLKSCSEQPAQPLANLADGDPNTFWVSTTGKLRVGPSRQRPAWVQFEFLAPTSVDRITIQPRPGYGPRDCELQVSDNGKDYRTVKPFRVDEKQETTVKFDAVSGRAFRLVVFSAYDVGSPQAARNVQIAELRLAGKEGSWPDAGVRRPIRNWEQKAGHKPLHFSAPDTTPLLEEETAEPGEEDTRAADVLDLTANLDKDGTLRWDVPAGSWQVFRFGYTIGNHSYVSTSSEGWQGFSLDVLDAGAFGRYWDAVVEPLIADAGPLTGTTLKYLHTDSWEVEPLNWTPAIREEFQRRRGYDLLPWLPVLAGRIVESRGASNRFLHDFRKTLGDLAIDNHYRPFRDRAYRHNLLIHPESGGPHAVPVDAQRCLGFNDVPMSEFWAWSWRHRIGDQNRFFVKQPASAAHTYGRRLVAAEGFTTIGPHWQETLWDNLKPAFDKACCEGLNLLVWHAFVCSPAEQGLPGIQYFAGTHLNPNVTWWAKSKPFFDYINRCQFLLQQGLFVADACYYYGDHVPNFAQHKRTDPAGVLPGYDYDVITEEALLSRAAVRDGLIVLPDGMSYRVLVLRRGPAHSGESSEQNVPVPISAHGFGISLPVLRKVQELVEAGATVVGAKPTEAMSQQDSDAEVIQIADALWGRGRVVADKTARDVLLAAGVRPDFEFSAGDGETDLDYIHRRDGTADIYFVANRAPRPESVTCTFRVAGKAPELWDPVTGSRRFAAAYTETDGRTVLPLDFSPCGSCFIVFREPAAKHPPAAQSNATQWTLQSELTGSWTVAFDPKWGALGTVEFANLVNWPDRDEPGIKFYSGTAVYRKKFELPADWQSLQNRRGLAHFAESSEQNVPVPFSARGFGIGSHGSRLWLDMGNVRELAEVKVNGKACGIAWSPPFRVDISDAVKPGANQLEIEVVNFWPNRLIGDDSLPPEQRFTRTNIRKLTKDIKLMDSGLFGPVTLQAAKPAGAK